MPRGLEYFPSHNPPYCPSTISTISLSPFHPLPSQSNPNTNKTRPQYYVYAGDLVQGVEDLRTPLQTILDLEQQIRGSIAGFMTPQFVVDLPGGGGKRLAASYKSYDRDTGISTFVAPAVKGGNTVYEYFDPLHSLSEVERVRWEAEGRT